MENNNKGWWIAGTILVILVLVAGGTYIYDRFAPVKEDNIPMEENPEFVSNCGLTIENVAAGETVSFPLTLTGTINNQPGAECSWLMFEGQAGVVTLHYQTKDGWSLPVDTEPIPVADWMSTSTTFSVTLDYDNSSNKLPSGFDFKVIFTEDDPSGEGDVNTLELPLVLE